MPRPPAVALSNPAVRAALDTDDRITHLHRICGPVVREIRSPETVAAEHVRCPVAVTTFTQTTNVGTLTVSRAARTQAACYFGDKYTQCSAHHKREGSEAKGEDISSLETQDPCDIGHPGLLAIL
jgi:hypothetical protein